MVTVLSIDFLKREQLPYLKETEVNMDTERLLLTIPEVAIRLGLGRSLIYLLVMRGEIDSLKVGRARRVPAEALERFIEDKMAEEKTD